MGHHANNPRCQRIAFGCASLASLMVVLAIYFGSGRLARFDVPLAAYSAATVFAAFGLVYRYMMWLQRPPTWRYFKVSWRLFFQARRFVPNCAVLSRLVVDNILLQRFVARRGRTRWAAHMCIAWGCMIAFAITFPLSWGWVQFGVDHERYVVEFMGRRQFSFPPSSILGFLMFNGLNISAVLVLIGVAAAMHRRIHQHGAQAVQSLSSDLIPLFLLFAVSVTGLMLTASYRLMEGEHFSFLSLLHAVAVIVFLLWMPFGKLFHIVQRPAQIGVQFYKQEGARGEQALCARSGQEYQSRMHHDDLVAVMKDVGFDFGEHQNLAPETKRKLIALNQAALMEDVPFVG